MMKLFKLLKMENKYMLEYFTNMQQKENFLCASTMQRALILCKVLQQADIRRVTPYIAAQYGEEFGTGWKDNKDLVMKFYKTHMHELYAYNAYRLNKILEYLVENIRVVTKQSTIRVDAAVIENLNNLTDTLMQNNGAAIEIESSLCTTIDDLLAGKSCIRRPIVNEFELLNTLVQNNVEINKDHKLTKFGENRYDTYNFTNKLTSICLDIMKKIQLRQGICPAYKNWGILLEALYSIHVPWEWLYEQGYCKLFNNHHKCDRIEPYSSMELEEVLIDPKSNANVVYDDKLYKLSKCTHNANRPDNELVCAYVNEFYRIQNITENSITSDTEICTEAWGIKERILYKILDWLGMLYKKIHNGESYYYVTVKMISLKNKTVGVKHAYLYKFDEGHRVTVGEVSELLPKTWNIKSEEQIQQVFQEMIDICQASELGVYNVVLAGDTKTIAYQFTKRFNEEKQTST